MNGSLGKGERLHDEKSCRHYGQRQRFARLRMRKFPCNPWHPFYHVNHRASVCLAALKNGRVDEQMTMGELICRCGCRSQTSNMDSFVTCPQCGRTYANDSSFLYHPKTTEELRWKCNICGTINEDSDGTSRRLSCAKCGAFRGKSER